MRLEALKGVELDAKKFALAVVVTVAIVGRSRGQDVRSDSVYTWFVAESAAKPLIMAQSAQFDRRYYRVFMDSVRVDDVVLFRLFVGRYETRYAALEDQVAIPLPLQEKASLLRLPIDRLMQLPAESGMNLETRFHRKDTVAAIQTSEESDTVDQAVNVYIDCNGCDMPFIRRQVTFVNWVRDQADADVHVLVTGRSSAAGTEQTFYFVGQRSFAALVDTLRFVSSGTDTKDERRRAIAQTIRLGLVRYVARTPEGAKIRVVSLKRIRGVQRVDPWKSWTFRISGTGSYDEEKSTKSYNVGAGLDISRITDEWKVKLSGSGTYSGSRYDVKERVISSSKRSGKTRGQAIRSLGSRWSAGLFGSASTSSFRNTNLSVVVAPALEFNVFPYTESNRKELRLAYYLNLRASDYKEVTLFRKTAERMLEHEFQVNLALTQLWGSAYVSLSASNYLTDFERSMTDLYRLDAYAYVQIRIVRGLSFWAEATLSRIRDQVYLPLKSASEEEILLGTIELPTDFSFAFEGGISFTFGSIYNNVVNARFGS